MEARCYHEPASFLQQELEQFDLLEKMLARYCAAEPERSEIWSQHI